MKLASSLNLRLFLLFVLFCFVSTSQSIQVEVIGGSIVTQTSTLAITAGNTINFRITTTSSSCATLRIQNISLTNSDDFSISNSGTPANIKPDQCMGGNKYFDFVVTNISGFCTASTDVMIESNSNPDALFTFSINGSPEINVLGGSPSADILNGSTTTSSINGTSFGILEEGEVETRYYIISNKGNCPLDITGLSSSLSDFAVPFNPAAYVLSPSYSPTFLPASIDAGSYVILPVTFTGPVGGSGTLTSTISILNSDNTTLTFTVSAEMFDYNIPGPGGVTDEFRLWLKSTRGIIKSGNSVTDWLDLGSNGKDAITDTGKEPTYLDTASENINFNPVIKFENDGASTEQYMYNSSNGFYSQDIFIVMMPDETMTSASSRNTIFAGVDSRSAGDITGVGFGDYSSEFTNETLSYNQDISGGGSFNGEAEINGSYSKAGIINIRNNDITSPTGQEILYNSNLLTTSSVSDISFANVGYIDTTPNPDVTIGTEYWIGKNYDSAGSLNGRVAEIFTFAERVSDSDRQKIESYLAIKYGLTLGSSYEAEKDYVNSFGTSVWDVSMNMNFNYHVAGIGRDSISDLNQKQSKTLNTDNEVTIGLNGIFSTNSSNINEFVKDGDFLVWGSNNDSFSGTSTNTITIATGIKTTLTRIDREWKIVESVEDVDGDVGNVFISIPTSAFNSFPLVGDEEYALVVADNANFANSHIVDVIPLKSDGESNLQTWYDFDGTKYFTFGKVEKLEENHSVNIASGDYLVGEYALNLNINDFTISAWVKADNTQTSTRTIMAKGEKLQLRLNSLHKIEVVVDDDTTPRFTSDMVLNDNKWHQISFVYNSGTIFLYVDGVLDKSEQNVVAPSPNFNRFSVGAVYIDKDNITNPFLGDIDEIYVWDQGLTQYQVRYLMNQEIEKSSCDNVTGKVLPKGSTSSEVMNIPWSTLKAYYDFNSFYGSTVEGLTDDRNFLRLKYLSKDKTLIEEQKIPVPYLSMADGNWSDYSTWSNSADVVLPNSLSLDGSTYIDWNIVQLDHNITSGDNDITVLGLLQNSGTLTIQDPVITLPIENNDGQSLRVTHYLEIDGVIDLVGESQLIQDEGSVLDADSGGYIERDQQGTANAFNYNYWSSSVGPISGNIGTNGTGVSRTNSNYSVAGVLNDGTDSSLYHNITFSGNYKAADSNTPSSPRVISSYWIYKFYGSAGDSNSWTALNENSSLLPGEGYTMKGTSGSTDIENLQNYVFKGLPNNGDITLALDKSSGDVQRLIGNPYPSAIDANEFILDNIKTIETINGELGRNTTNVINGALYFWHHFGDVDSHKFADYVGGYATYTLMGGTEAYSTSDLINNSNPTLAGGKIPEQYIPVGQGFFVSTTLPSGISGTTSTVEGGHVVFKNSQRVFVREEATGVNDGSVFFKGSKTKSKQSASNDRSRIRLQFESSTGFKRQILIGADAITTDDFDLGYDAPMIDTNKDDMYWFQNNEEFVIQGVSNFNKNKEYPIGIKVSRPGDIKIKISQVENFKSDIYLLDKSTNTTFLINEDFFSIYMMPGVYNERFSLVFEPSLMETLGVNSNEISTFYDSKNNILNINLHSTNNEVESIAIFNFKGQEVAVIQKNLGHNMSFEIEPGLYILNLKSKKGIIRKKIMLK